MLCKSIISVHNKKFFMTSLRIYLVNFNLLTKGEKMPRYNVQCGSCLILLDADHRALNNYKRRTSLACFSNFMTMSTLEP